MENYIKNSEFRDSGGEGIPDMFIEIGTSGIFAVSETPIISSREGNVLSVEVKDNSGSGIYQNIALDNGSYILSAILRGFADVVAKIEEIDSALTVGNKIAEETFRVGTAGNKAISLPFTLSDTTKDGVKVSVYGVEFDGKHNYELCNIQINEGSEVKSYVCTKLDIEEILDDYIGV